MCLQGQGGGQGVLCKVNDVAPRLVEKQGLVDIPVKYVMAIAFGWAGDAGWMLQQTSSSEEALDRIIEWGRCGQ